MTAVLASPRQRLGSALIALAIEALVAVALWLGLAPGRLPAPDVDRAIAYISPVAPPPAPPKPAADRSDRPVGRAAPRHRRADPVPVVAPPPVIPTLILPPPITAVPVPALGPAAEAGAATGNEPGTGTGGGGEGLGSGGDGTGTGGGRRAEQIGGDIRDSDYPWAALRDHAQGGVRVRYTIGTNGRIRRCDIVRSSGNAQLDEITCRLSIRRYRYRPARDADGRKVEDAELITHRWVIVPPGEDVEAARQALREQGWQGAGDPR